MPCKGRFLGKRVSLGDIPTENGAWNILGQVHYANMSVQYTAIFHGCKNDNFQMKKFDIFLIFAQNIHCGYTLEPPQ